MLKKGRVTIAPADAGEAIASGQCYYLTRQAPSGRVQAGGTIARLEWASEDAAAQAGPGRYALRFEDGTRIEVTVTKHLQTACGPDVLRFTAVAPPPTAE